MLLMVFSSCGTYRVFTGNIKYDASKQNQIVKSSELTTYLQSKEKLKFVLRTPDGFENFSVEEQTMWNDVFGQIEKELIRKGHIVKDRILLNRLMDRGGDNIVTFSNALNTDVIIEIIDVDFDIENQVQEFDIKEKNFKTNFNVWNNIDYIDCRLAMLECRITLVDEGNVGGIFKFYVSGCDEGRDFYLKVFEEYDGTLNNEDESYVGWYYGNTNYKFLTHTYDVNDLSRAMAISRLVEALLNELIVPGK